MEDNNLEQELIEGGVFSFIPVSFREVEGFLFGTISSTQAPIGCIIYEPESKGFKVNTGNKETVELVSLNSYHIGYLTDYEKESSGLDEISSEDIDPNKDYYLMCENEVPYMLNGKVVLVENYKPKGN